MKAMVLYETSPIETGPLRFIDVPEPVPGPGEVLIRVRTCGICRTDLHVIEGELPRRKLPIIPGHQIVGVVEQTGAGCTDLRAGQRVGVAWLRGVCGTCRFCIRGRENLCEASRYTGYDADGGYAEYAVAPERFVYSLPDAFGDIEAAPLLCAGIIGYRALQRCAMPAGGTLALYGFGSSAHVVFQLARHRGHTVYVVSRGQRHQQLAREMGADWVGDDPAELPQPADGAVIFAPAGHLVPRALQSLQKGGTLVLAGIYMSEIPAMTYEEHLFYERDVRSVTANTREDGRALLKEAARIPVKPRVTSYPLSDANRALQDLKADRIEGSGVLILSD